MVLVTWREESCLETGANFAMSGGTLCAAERITIGNHVAIGVNTTIVDTDFHPLRRRGAGWTLRRAGQQQLSSRMRCSSG